MQVSVLEGHRLWAASYDTVANPLLALESRLLPGIIGQVAAKRVVDVACGTGRWAVWLQARGADVVGVDFCNEMVERAPSQVRGRLFIGDAASLPIAPAVADLTICSFAAGYFHDLEPVLAEMARVTRFGGRVILADLHPDAIARGWTRSFRSGTAAYEIEHFAHSLQEMRGAARDAGLETQLEHQAHFGEQERPIFETAGKRFADFVNIPAVWMGRWEKA